MALFTVLVFLLLATLLALFAAKQSAMQERAAAGQRSASQAMAAAESAARQAEHTIYRYYLNSNGRVLTGDGFASQGVYDAAIVENQDFLHAFLQGREWHVGGSTPFPAGKYAFDHPADSRERLARQPAYIIEDLGRVRPPGASAAREGGSTGTEGYDPASSADDRVYRITAKGSGALPGVVRTVQATFSGRAKG